MCSQVATRDSFLDLPHTQTSTRGTFDAAKCCNQSQDKSTALSNPEFLLSRPTKDAASVFCTRYTCRTFRSDSSSGHILQPHVHRGSDLTTYSRERTVCARHPVRNPKMQADRKDRIWIGATSRTSGFYRLNLNSKSAEQV